MRYGCLMVNMSLPENTLLPVGLLGAGEMWMYHISGGEGIQLTKRKNDQQDVNEPTISS
jgi:hypothetical protein